MPVAVNKRRNLLLDRFGFDDGEDNRNFGGNRSAFDPRDCAEFESHGIFRRFLDSFHAERNIVHSDIISYSAGDCLPVRTGDIDLPDHNGIRPVAGIGKWLCRSQGGFPVAIERGFPLHGRLIDDLLRELGIEIDLDESVALLGRIVVALVVAQPCRLPFDPAARIRGTVEIL